MGGLRIGDFIPWLSWINWLDGSDARVEKVFTDFDFILEQIVNEHQDRRKSSFRDGSESENDEKVEEFVDVLLDVQEENTVGFSIDRDNIKALILVMFSLLFLLIWLRFYSELFDVFMLLIFAMIFEAFMNHQIRLK